MIKKLGNHMDRRKTFTPKKSLACKWIFLKSAAEKDTTKHCSYSFLFV
jgi:hypothetical protein